ncbi:MAG: lipoyl synthase [Muribaculaceae bacterium]|nr:lipoyl synthase [Muribaculaceae bacterium]
MKNYYHRKPEWLRIKLPHGEKSARVCGNLNARGLHSICVSGLCPNRGECWSNGTATFMIGGDTCTRNCRFCNVTTGRPKPLDPGEIQGVIDAVRDLNLRHVVLTSVDRDDLPDYGAAHWAAMLRRLREECPGVTVEALVPDFNGRLDLLDLVIAERPEVISHNLETVRRLTPEVRCHATYDGSLKVIAHIASSGVRAKSGIMLGLGETPEEIVAVMDDLRAVGCHVMTIGQYLQPTEHHYHVKEYIHPDIFEQYRVMALSKGFVHVESAPLVRSSYHAELHLL